MLIRCEKCSTVYELEDQLIPPGGAPVQCSRCEHVFRAMPPRAARPTPAPRPVLREVKLEPDPEPVAEERPVEPEPETAPVPVPVAAEAVEAATPTPTAAASETRIETPTPTPTVETKTATATPPPAEAPPPAPAKPEAPKPQYVGVTADGRPIRKIPNPELEQGDVPVAPQPRRAMSFEVGPRKKQGGRWAIAGAAALVVGLGVVGIVLRAREEAASRPPPVQTAADPGAARVRQEGLALLARDDAASLERAASLLDEAVRREKGSPGARADRALSFALLSQEAREEAGRLGARARAAEEQRQAAEAAGDGARAAILSHDAEVFRAGVAPARERAARLAGEARAELDAIPSERQRDPVVLRARAMAFVAAGQRGEAARIARDARGLVDDGWLSLAGILADVPENAGAEEHLRALDALEKLSAAHPELVRPRFLAARIRAGMADADGALAALDGVLQANPEHLEAKRLRAELVAAAAPPPPPAGEGAPLVEEPSPLQPAPAGAAPAENPPSQPRNAVTQGQAR